jgi:hypothetical protein
MKTTAVLGMLGVMLSVAAVAKAATPSDACGNERMTFKVKNLKKQPLAPEPKEGMSRVVFVQSLDGDFNADPITRFAIDGTWVAADKGSAYVTIDVSPGTHKVCVSPQTGIRDYDSKIGIATLNAVAGKTTFYDFTVKREEVGTLERANGGSGGAASPAGTGSTPNMTAKLKDTIDSATFAELDPAKGMALAQKLPYSATTSR